VLGCAAGPARVEDRPGPGQQQPRLQASPGRIRPRGIPARISPGGSTGALPGPARAPFGPTGSPPHGGGDCASPPRRAWAHAWGRGPARFGTRGPVRAETPITVPPLPTHTASAAHAPTPSPARELALPSPKPLIRVSLAPPHPSLPNHCSRALPQGPARVEDRAGPGQQRPASIPQADSAPHWRSARARPCVGCSGASRRCTPTAGPCATAPTHRDSPAPPPLWHTPTRPSPARDPALPSPTPIAEAIRVSLTASQPTTPPTPPQPAYEYRPCPPRAPGPGADWPTPAPRPARGNAATGSSLCPSPSLSPSLLRGACRAGVPGRTGAGPR
jgi:hypothetical protein